MHISTDGVVHLPFATDTKMNFGGGDHLKKTLCLAVLALLVTASASAATIVLTFEGLQNLETIGDFYNGGTGGSGSGPGPNYGISFGVDSLAIICAPNGGTGNCENPPSGGTLAFFLSGPGDVMNVAGGFDTGFSFFYSAAVAGSVTVYDGLNGTGSVLASLDLPVTPGYCNSTHYYSCWTPVGVAFSGTAMSVVFSGSADYIGFDDITLGSDIPGGQVPEPASLLLIGSGLVGLARKFRK